MTIIIPTWIVVVLIILVIVRGYIGFKRATKIIGGLKEWFPLFKSFMESGKTVSITIAKKLNENEDSGTR